MWDTITAPHNDCAARKCADSSVPIGFTLDWLGKYFSSNTTADYSSPPDDERHIQQEA